MREIARAWETLAPPLRAAILLKQTFADLCGLRVFELHQFHGLHVHLVTNRFLDVDKARQLAKQAGWGRIHVMRIPIERAGYLAKYLSKERPECLKRWRLWAGFGKWDWTRVSFRPHRVEQSWMMGTARSGEAGDFTRRAWQLFRNRSRP